MKKYALSLLFTLLCIASFAQITITDSGRNLIIKKGNVTRTLPKVNITTTFNDPYYRLLYKYETIFSISDHTEVTTPSSTSLSDLQTKILAMFPANSGGAETDPTVPAAVKGITAGDVDRWNGGANIEVEIENESGLLDFLKQTITHLNSPSSTSVGMAEWGDSVSLLLNPAIKSYLSPRLNFRTLEYPGDAYNSMAAATFTGTVDNSGAKDVNHNVLDGTGGFADFTYVPGGDHFTLSSGATFSATTGETNGMTRCRVIFSKRTGGGTATVNIYNRDTNALLSTNSVNLSGAISPEKLTFVLDPTVKHKIEIVASGGVVTVLRVVIDDGKGLSLLRLSRGGSTLTQNNYSNKSILNFLLTEFNVSLIMLCCKEEDIDVSLSPTMNTLNSYPSVSKLIIASAPDSGGEGFLAVTNGKFRNAAKLNRFAFFDAQKFGGSYSKMVSLGLMSDNTHPNQTFYDMLVRQIFHKIFISDTDTFKGNIDQRGNANSAAHLNSVSLINSDNSSLQLLTSVGLGAGIYRGQIRNIRDIYFGDPTVNNTMYVTPYGTDDIELKSVAGSLKRFRLLGVSLNDDGTQSRVVFSSGYNGNKGWDMQNAGGTTNRQMLRGYTGGVNTINLDPAGVSLFTQEVQFVGGIRTGSATGPWVKSGTGTPEGVQSAPVGSIWTRTDGGAGSTFYVKETGTGNTGWVAK